MAAPQLVGVLPIFTLDSAREPNQVAPRARMDCAGIRIVQFELLINERGQFFGVLCDGAPQLIIGQIFALHIFFPERMLPGRTRALAARARAVTNRDWFEIEKKPQSFSISVADKNILANWLVGAS